MWGFGVRGNKDCGSIQACAEAICNLVRRSRDGKGMCPARVKCPSLAALPLAPSTALLKSPERSSAENELWMSYSVDILPRAAFYPDASEDRAIIWDTLAEICCCGPGFKTRSGAT